MDVTLTFDNGPEPAVTPRVLDILGNAGIQATFFVLGSKLADPERRGIAKRAFAEGHWIGNHTKTHSVPLGRVADSTTVIEEIVDTQALIASWRIPIACSARSGAAATWGLISSTGPRSRC